MLLRAWVALAVAASVAVSASAAAAACDVNAAMLVDAGFKISNTETFNGNGRTCGTCHAPEHAYTISPADIATLSPTARKIVLGGTNTTLENATLVEKFALFNISDSTPGAPGNNLMPEGPFRTSMQITGLALTTLNECPNVVSIATATTTGVPTAQITLATPPPFPFVMGQSIGISGVSVAGYNLFAARISAVI